MGILDFFNQQAWNEQQANSPYTPEMRMNAGMQQLGLLGGSLMAAGAPSTNPGQFGQTMGQYAAQAGPQMQQILDSQFQMGEYQKEQERQAAMQEYLASGAGGILSPDEVEFLNMAGPELGMGLLADRMFAPAGDDPLVEAIDPNTGLPTYVPESQAAGMQAGYGQTPDTSDAARLYAEEQQGLVPPGTFMAKYGQQTPSDNRPSNVAEWEYYNSLSPEDQQRYLAMKRATQVIDLGDRTVIPDPTNPAGEPVASFPEGLGPSRQTVDGTVVTTPAMSGDALAGGNQPTVADIPMSPEQTRVKSEAGQDMIALIDQLVSHPGLPGAVGIPSLQGALNIPGTQEASFEQLRSQIQGNVFMQAYESLKGGGQITEVESAQATVALARLGTAQTEKDFIAAANEFKSIVQRGLDRLNGTGGGTPSPQTNVPTPETAKHVADGADGRTIYSNDGVTWYDASGQEIR